MRIGFSSPRGTIAGLQSPLCACLASRMGQTTIGCELHVPHALLWACPEHGSVSAQLANKQRYLQSQSCERLQSARKISFVGKLASELKVLPNFELLCPR
mmetsp:Transcript_18365/g.58535  ORF Transcript_18365/g.58535 Transcript_18365/m.58535 type:complete len:100 (-) Transcript_18365:1944-2243(-)